MDIPIEQVTVFPFWAVAGTFPITALMLLLASLPLKKSDMGLTIQGIWEDLPIFLIYVHPTRAENVRRKCEKGNDKMILVNFLHTWSFRSPCTRETARSAALEAPFRNPPTSLVPLAAGSTVQFLRRRRRMHDWRAILLRKMVLLVRDRGFRLAAEEMNDVSA
jgi:hypothetical protein